MTKINNVVLETFETKLKRHFIIKMKYINHIRFQDINGKKYTSVIAVAFWTLFIYIYIYIFIYTLLIIRISSMGAVAYSRSILNTSDCYAALSVTSVP